MDNFAEMNGEYAKWFAHKPSRSCVAVHQLPFGVPVRRLKISNKKAVANIVQVEIEVVALQ